MNLRIVPGSDKTVPDRGYYSVTSDRNKRGIVSQQYEEPSDDIQGIEVENSSLGECKKYETLGVSPSKHRFSFRSCSTTPIRRYQEAGPKIFDSAARGADGSGSTRCAECSDNHGVSRSMELGCCKANSCASVSSHSSITKIKCQSLTADNEVGKNYPQDCSLGAFVNSAKDPRVCEVETAKKIQQELAGPHVGQEKEFKFANPRENLEKHRNIRVKQIDEAITDLTRPNECQGLEPWLEIESKDAIPVIIELRCDGSKAGESESFLPNTTEAEYRDLWKVLRPACEIGAVTTVSQTKKSDRDSLGRRSPNIALGTKKLTFGDGNEHRKTRTCASAALEAVQPNTSRPDIPNSEREEFIASKTPTYDYFQSPNYPATRAARGNQAGCISHTTRKSAPQCDLVLTNCCSCNDEKRILSHRVTLLQSQLEVQLETSKKLARMCKVLRHEHAKEVQHYRKIISATDFKGAEHVSVSAENRKSNQFNSRYMGLGFAQQQQEPWTVECIRLRNKVHSLQTQLSKESIRAMRVKECLRLREVVNNLQTKLSQALARALRAEQNFERLRTEVRVNYAPLKHVATSTNTDEENELHGSSQPFAVLNFPCLESQEETTKQQGEEQILLVEKWKKIEEIAHEYELKNREMQAQIISLQDSLLGKERESGILGQELEKKLQFMEKKLQFMETENLQLRETVNFLEGDNLKLQKLILSNEKESDIRGQVFEKKLQSMETENLQLRETVSCLKDDNVKLQKSLLSNEKESDICVKKIEKKLQSMETENLHLRETVNDFELKCSGDQQNAPKSNSIMNDLKRYEEIVAENAAESVYFNLALQEALQKNKMLYSDLQETVLSHQTLQASFKMVCENEHSLKIRLDDLERQLSAQAKELENAEKEKRFLQVRLESIKSQYEELEVVLQTVHSSQVEFDPDRKCAVAQNDLEEKGQLPFSCKTRDDLPTIKNAAGVNKIIDGHAFVESFVECQKSDPLHDFKAEVSCNQDEEIEKYRQDVITLKSLLCQESEKAKVSIVEASNLSSELCKQKENQAQLAQKYAQEVYQLKHLHNSQLESMDNLLVKILATFLKTLHNIEIIVSTKLKLAVVGLQKKVARLERNLARQKEETLEMMALISKKVSMAENLTSELELRDNKIKFLLDSKVETEERMQMTVNKLRNLESVLMQNVQDEESETYMKPESQQIQNLEAVVLDFKYSKKEADARCKQLEFSLLQLAGTNAELSVALSNLQSVLKTEVGRARKAEALLAYEQKSREDADVFRQIVAQLLEAATQKPIELPFGLSFSSHENEKVFEEAEITKRDLIQVLKQLIDEREILIGIVMLPEFQNPKIAPIPCSRLNSVAHCSECESLRNQIIKQEDDLVNSENEKKKLQVTILKMRQELLRHGLRLERLKREQSLVLTDLAKSSAYVESLRSLQEGLVYERDNILNENAHLQSLVKELRSLSVDEINHENGSIVEPSLKRIQHDPNLNASETQILVGVVQKLLKYQSDGAVNFE